MFYFRNWLRKVASRLGYRITWRPKPERFQYHPHVEPLEVRLVPSTVKWTAASGSWSVAGNWTDQSDSTHHIPGAGDDVIIDTAVTVTHSASTDSVASLVFGASSIASFVTVSGGTLNVSGNLQGQGTGTFTLSGGTLGNAIIANGTPMNVTSNSALTAVTLAGDMAIGAGATLTVNQGLTLSGGHIEMEGSDNAIQTPSFLTFAGTGTQTLGGSGQVAFANFDGHFGAGANVISSTAGPLTVASGVSVIVDATHPSGGTVGGSQALTINGTVTATAGKTIAVTGSSVTNAGPGSGTSLQANGGALTVTNLQSNAGGIAATSGTLTINGAWQNAGAISETNSTLNLGGTFATSTSGVNSLSLTGGTVNITGTLTNDSPFLSIGAGPTWNLKGGAISGGTVTLASGMNVTANSTMTAVTLACDLAIGAGVTLTVNQGLTLSGGHIEMEGSDNSFQSPSFLTFAGTGMQTLGGSGQVAFANFDGHFGAGANVISSTSGPLTVASSVSVIVDATHPSGGTLGGTQALTINGTVTATAGKTIAVTGSSVTNAGPGSGTSLQANGGALAITNLQSNAGGIAATLGGALTIDGAWQNAGSISETSSTLNLGGTFSTSTSGVNNLSLSGGTVNIIGVLTNNSPFLSIGAETTWNLKGGTILGGTVTVASGNQLNAINNPNVSAPVLGGAAGTTVTLAGKLVVAFGATLTVNQGLTLSNGTVELDGSDNSFQSPSLLTFAGTGTQTSGAAARWSLRTSMATSARGPT